MRVLDLDMDFFLNNVAVDKPFSNKKRLPNSDFIPWSEKQIRHFIEFNCGLSKKIKGRKFKEHKEVFYFWRELIRKMELIAPFDVVHIDAHADLGLGDGAWAFIYQEVLNYPFSKRSLVETYRKKQENYEKLDSGNFLLYAIACRWVNSLVYITNPHSSGDDYLRDTMKHCEDDSGYLQLKRFTNPIDFNLEIEEQDYIAEPEVKFNIINEYMTYIEPKLDSFDFLVFSQSPSYTPKSADFIIEIIKDYIEEI